jgi:ribosomal protein S18 acetylase RimI-like enzyme
MVAVGVLRGCKTGGVDVRVVVVGREDAARIKALRVGALRGSPEGFGSTLEVERARPESFWSEWAEASEVGVEQRTFALVAGSEWVGLAMVRVWPARPDEAELLSMYVAPAYGGGGGARRLCDARAEWARARGVELLQLAVYESNGRARRAYEKCGFSVAGFKDEGLLRMERLV